MVEGTEGSRVSYYRYEESDRTELNGRLIPRMEGHPRNEGCLCGTHKGNDSKTVRLEGLTEVTRWRVLDGDFESGTGVLSGILREGHSSGKTQFGDPDPW